MDLETFKLSLINSASYNIYANWLKKYAFEPYFYSNVLLDSNVKHLNKKYGSKAYDIYVIALN